MSLIYKFDPRTKILLVMAFSVLIFLTDRFPLVVGLMLSFFILRLTLKVPFRGGKFLKILSMLVFFMILLQVLFGPGENYIVKPLFPPDFPLLGGMGSLKRDGLFLGLTAGCRLASLLILLPILTLTTSPQGISSGLAAFGLNYRVIFVITTAFNLIPLFQEEAVTIMDAQKLRSLRSFEEGSILARIRAYPGLVVPLVLGAMRKAQVSSVCMDSRAFGVYKTRTWLDKPVMKALDYIAIASCVIFSAAVLLLNYMVM